MLDRLHAECSKHSKGSLNSRGALCKGYFGFASLYTFIMQFRRWEETCQPPASSVIFSTGSVGKAFIASCLYQRPTYQHSSRDYCSMSFHHSFSDLLTPSFSLTLKRGKKKSIHLQISSLERPQDCDLPQPYQNKQTEQQHSHYCGGPFIFLVMAPGP